MVVPSLQDQMKRVIDAAVAGGHENGVQLAVYLNGKLVVDLWAGDMNDGSGRPIDGQTLFPVFSVTKGIAATVLHLMVERGKVSYETPIASVWPGFDQHGKGGITVRHALAHLAGLPWMPMGIGYEQILDWQTMCDLLAAEKPDRPPGVRQDYHAITFGWLVGEIAHRVDGRSFGQILHDEVTKPLGIADDLFVGIPDSAQPRVTLLDEKTPNPPAPPDDSRPQQIPGWMSPLHEMMNRPDSRRACIPGSGGIMTARAIARHYAALLPGGVDGIELLPPSRVRLATERHWPTDMDYGCMQMSLGYQLGMESSEMDKSHTAFGHAGYGGAMGFADPVKRLAVGFTRNSFGRPAMSPGLFQRLHELIR